MIMVSSLFVRTCERSKVGLAVVKSGSCHLKLVMMCGSVSAELLAVVAAR